MEPTDWRSSGGEEITTDAFRDAYQNQLQQMQRQAKRAITNDEAKRFGLDRQVLSRLVSDAALNQQAQALGLTISEQEIANAIASDPPSKEPAANSTARNSRSFCATMA